MFLKYQYIKDTANVLNRVGYDIHSSRGLDLFLTESLPITLFPLTCFTFDGYEPAIDAGYQIGGPIGAIRTPRNRSDVTAYIADILLDLFLDLGLKSHLQA